jgi:putative addiction module killer protein
LSVELAIRPSRQPRRQPLTSCGEWGRAARLTDLRARAKILVRIRRAERGHFGDVKLLEDGVSEMRIDCGPGYRVYFAREGRMVYLLLCGGDKSTQPADIKHAKTMWAAIKEELS